jgi:hypothetical protein
MLQGKHRIDARRTTGGHKTRQGCDRHQNDADHDNSREVVLS